MISIEKLKELAVWKEKINKENASWNNEFNQYRDELVQKARRVLKWKDEHFDTSYLRYKQMGYIHEIGSNYVVLCLPDIDWEQPTKYYNISFDELFTEDWKEKALQEYKEKQKKAAEEAKQLEEELRLAMEANERAEYERLKAKFEGGA